MKKLLAVLCCIGLLSLSGCSFIWPSASSDKESSNSAPFQAKYLSDYAGKWSYRHLDERFRQCYAALYAAVTDGFGWDETVSIADSSAGTEREYTGIKVTLPQSLHNREEAQLLYTAFTWDNPQFFYVGNTYSYEGYRVDETDYYNVFCLVFNMNAQERAVASRQLDAAIHVLMDALPYNASAFEKELLFHDRLVELCSYDDTAAKSDDPATQFPTAFTAYGALVEGKAVCEGYSRAMQLLMQEVNIECTLVSGFDIDGIPHMWNLITIDNRNYHLDVTWDDTEDLLRHTFFNITTAEISLTHTIDDENVGVDTCTATDANYYQHMGTYMNTYDRKAIAAVIAEKIKNNQDIIDLRFSKETYGNALLFIRTNTVFVPLMNSHLQAYNLTMWAYTCRERAEYCTITIYKQNS